MENFALNEMKKVQECFFPTDPDLAGFLGDVVFEFSVCFLGFQICRLGLGQAWAGPWVGRAWTLGWAVGCLLAIKRAVAQQKYRLLFHSRNRCP